MMAEQGSRRCSFSSPLVVVRHGADLAAVVRNADEEDGELWWCCSGS